MRLRLWGAALALGLFCILPARAEERLTPTALTAQQVLEKAAAARGGVKAGAYRRVYTITGSNGTVARREVVESKDDYVVTIHDGDFSTAYGETHGVGWEQDENGSVRTEADYRDAENPYVTSMREIEKADSGVKVLGVTTADPASIVLEVRPHAGLLQRRYYDAKTFLLQRIETTSYGGQTRIETYGDYTAKFGLTLPQTSTYADAHADNASKMQLLSFERVPASSISTAIPKGRPLFDLGGQNALRIPAEFTEHGIIVRVTVAGRGLDFELDSGASPIVIDAGVARNLGLTLYGTHTESFGGDFSSSKTRIADLALGDIHARNVAVEAIPYSDMVGDRKVVGLLGGDFFASARIRIDFKNSALWMEAPSKTAPASPWVGIPIEIDDLVPRAHAKFNGIDGAFIVDLGADLTMLYGHYFSNFTPKNKGDVMGQMVGIAGKGVDFKQYTFSRFDFGDLAFADANVAVTQGHSWEDEDYDGLLGRNILSSFNLLFDYANHELYVEPPPSN